MTHERDKEDEKEGAEKAEITPDMVEAGIRAVKQWEDSDLWSQRSFVVAVYSAMVSAANNDHPVLTSDD